MCNGAVEDDADGNEDYDDATFPPLLLVVVVALLLPPRGGSSVVMMLVMMVDDICDDGYVTMCCKCSVRTAGVIWEILVIVSDDCTDADDVDPRCSQ